MFVLILISMFRGQCIYELGIVQRVGRPQTSCSSPPPPSYVIAGRPKAALLFWFFGVLDVVLRYLSLFLLSINIKK